MALLRPYGKFAEIFGKSFITYKIEYHRRFVRVMPKQSYVTVAPKLCCTLLDIEKSEVSNNVDHIETTTSEKIYLELLRFCYNKKNKEIRKQDLASLWERNEILEKNISSDFIGLSLLRYSGQLLPNLKMAERQHFISTIWSFIEEKLPLPTLQHYNTLLRVYASNSHKVDPIQFLKSMKVSPDIETYKLLLNCTAKNGDVESTLYVVSLMKKMGYSLNEGVFNSIINAYAESGDMKSALSNVEIMKDARIRPSTRTWTNIACGYAKLGHIDDIKNILYSHKWSIEQLMTIAKQLSVSNNGERVSEILKFLPSDADFNNVTIANDIMELASRGRVEDSFNIVNHVTTNVSSDKRDTFLKNYLTNLVSVENSIDTVIKIVNSITEKKKYSSAIIDVCKAALEYGEGNLAMALFEIMCKKNIAVRPHYYWPLLLQASRKGGEAEIFLTMKHMLRLDVNLDYDTFFYYILPYISTTDVTCAVRKLFDIGIEPSRFITALINHLLSNGNYEDTFSLCTKYKSFVDYSKVIRPLSIAYKKNKNIDNCAKILRHAPLDKYYAEEFLMILFGKEACKSDAPIVVKFLKAFAAHGVQVKNWKEFTAHNETSTSMKNPLHYFKSSNAIPHPKDMSIDELECHLIELRSKEMNKRGALRKLLMLHCQNNNVKRVDEIKKEYDDNGYLWSSGMFSSLLSFCIRNGRMQEAQDLYKMLREYHADFKIDGLKIVQFATALFEDKKIEEAIAVLESTRSWGGSVLEKECWRLLNSIAQSDFPEMAEEVLDILVKGGYCTRTNALLGTLVRRHLLKNDLPSAIDTFKRIGKQYKCTPLRQELIHALLKTIKTDETTRHRSMNLLEDVRTISDDIHGSGATNIDLFVGFVRNEMLTELQNFTKEVRLSEEMIAKSLEYISEDVKLEILPKILDSWPTAQKRKRMLICEKLLSLYNRSGDCQGAIELWRKMSKENLTASRIFTMNFVDLLEKHNVPLPEDFENFLS